MKMTPLGASPLKPRPARFGTWHSAKPIQQQGQNGILCQGELKGLGAYSAFAFGPDKGYILFTFPHGGYWVSTQDNQVMELVVEPQGIRPRPLSFLALGLKQRLLAEAQKVQEVFALYDQLARAKDSIH